MLRASGETVEGPRACDWFDVFADERGNLVLVLLDLSRTADSSDSFLAGLIQSMKAALQGHEPLHRVVGGLELQLAVHPGVEAKLVILRMSQRDARVEVLNAGMPAIANAGPAGRLELYPALSSPVGRRVGEVHPYELVPLVWGGTWLAVTDGMLNGSLEQDNVAALCAKLDLESCGLALAEASPEDLYDAFQGVLTSARFLRDDATGVLIAADPQARFQSGIL